MDYSANLSYGLALTDQHPDFSVYYLRKCFAEKPFDEPLIISLLHSADTADDWATAKEVVEKLLKHPDKIGSFTKALTFNNIGIAELDLIFEDKSYLPRAMEALEKGLKIARQDDQTDLWYLHANLWRCFLAKGDLKRAMEEAEKGKEFDPPADVSDWDKARKWLWFEAFFNTKEHIAEEQIQQMYKTLSRTGPGV